MSGTAAEHGVLGRLIATDPAQFAAEHWGRHPLLSRADDLPASFSDLLSSPAVDELISQRGLRTPFLRVAKNGTTLPERAFTSPGGVGAGIADQVSDDKLVRLFADGSTLVLQALHRVWPPIITLCQQLADELGHPVQANAYVTPAQNQGFSAHYDVHDVFVVQLEGEKRWRIHAPVLEHPLRNQPWTDRQQAVARQAEGPPVLEATLRPGDCLYLPRGFLHSATALGAVSIHLTLGVHVWTRHALAEELLHQVLRTVAEDPAVRGSLPLGVDVADPTAWRSDLATVTSALAEALRGVDPEAVSDALRRTALGTQRAEPIGPLQQLSDADRVQPDTAIRLRAHLAATLDQAGGRTVLRSRAADFAAGEEDVAPLKTLLASGSARAEDLGLGLARRLLRAGLAVLG